MSSASSIVSSLSETNKRGGKSNLVNRRKMAKSQVQRPCQTHSFLRQRREDFLAGAQLKVKSRQIFLLIANVAHLLHTEPLAY